MENFWRDTRWSNPRLDQKVYLWEDGKVVEAEYAGHGNYYSEAWGQEFPFSGRWTPREIPAPPVE